MPKKLEYRASEPLILTEQEIQDSVKTIVKKMSQARYTEFWDSLEVEDGERLVGV